MACQAACYCPGIAFEGINLMVALLFLLRVKNNSKISRSFPSAVADVSLSGIVQYVAAMIGLFGQATDRLCQKLDEAASNGEDVEMESLFSRLTLDIIGKAVFNYDFDSLNIDAGIVEVFVSSFLLV